MVSTMRLVIEACFSALIYSMYAGCHFSSAKLLYAKAEYLLFLICMASALFPRLDCLWHIYLSTNCLSTWWDIPFGKMDAVLHCSASRLQHLWFLTECFFHRLLCAFGSKARGTTNVKLAKKLLVLNEVYMGMWLCSFRTIRILSLSQDFCSAAGALHVLVVWISWWCWCALAVLAAENTGTFLLQWKCRHWHVCLWSHTASFPKLFFLQGHSDSCDIYIPHSVLVIPESFLLSELMPLHLLTQWSLRVVVFLFTINILQHFQVILMGFTIVSSLDFQIFQNSEIRMPTPLTWPALRRVCQVFISQSNTRLN